MVETGNMSPDQQAMQEKLQNMSPEELAEYQKKNCIFCQIISGKVQSKKVYEDSKCIAILDINPSNPGHILLLPKEHYAIMPQMPEDVTGHLFMITKALSKIILKNLKVTGTTIFVANGIAAGQKAQHFMLHVIPRKEKDGLDVLNIPQKQVSESDMIEVQKRLVGKVNEVFGIKQDVKSPKDDLDELKKVAEKPEKKDNDEESEEDQEDDESEENQEDDESEEKDKKKEDEENDDGESEEDQEDDESEKDQNNINLDDITRLLK